MLSGCGGGGAAAGTTGATVSATAVPVAAKLSLSASPTTVKSDNTTSTTITIAALNAGNAAIPGTTVNLSADTGVLGAAAVVTGATGTATVSFSAGASNINRTATITATAGAVSAQIPVQIVGSTVAVASSGTSVPAGGLTPVTITITAKDAAGITVTGAAVALTQTGAGTVTITPASGVTNASGQFVATIAGATAGAVTVNATALGATGTTALTVSPAAATFAITQQTLNGVIVAGNPKPTAMKIGAPNSLAIQVNAPAPTTNVTFATTTGVWNATTAVVTVPVVAGKATATLTSNQAGVATIQVYDAAAPATSDTLSVGMTAATAASITLQPTPAVVPRSVGTTTGSSTLVAMVRDALGAPVGGVPIAFSIVNPTGGGETVSPVVVFSAATTAGGLNLGEARTSFTSGSSSTAAGGVQIRASVVGAAPAVTTSVLPSGLDATIIIGGTAGSVAFGQATSVATDATGANYVLNMSVLVADSNGNPAPLGTVVNLSSWPIAWSTGSGCTPDADSYTPPVAPATVGLGKGTFYNEDINENLILDTVPVEDGVRTRYKGTIATGAGTLDATLNPPNSAGGTLPASVITDANGVAAFTLTYTKTNAIWITTRIRARTIVQGTSTVGETAFRLAPSLLDSNPPTLCLLPNSPYLF